MWRSVSRILEHCTFSSALTRPSKCLEVACRSLSITPSLHIKEVTETITGETLNIRADIVPSPRQGLIVKPEEIEINNKKPCYMCALDLNVKHTDVLILSQFLRSDGCMLPRRITGLCIRQQKKIGEMVRMAHKAGLMMNFTPPNCKRDPTRRKDWKKFNTYYDETTIFRKGKEKTFGDNFKTRTKGTLVN